MAKKLCIKLPKKYKRNVVNRFKLAKFKRVRNIPYLYSNNRYCKICTLSCSTCSIKILNNKYCIDIFNKILGKGYMRILSVSVGSVCFAAEDKKQAELALGKINQFIENNIEWVKDWKKEVRYGQKKHRRQAG